MTTPLSKTAAIARARREVSIWGQRTSWTIAGPYRVDDLDGPATEHHVSSYVQARIARTVWRARIVLALMERLTDDARRAIDDGPGYGITDLQRLVKAGLAASTLASAFRDALDSRTPQTVTHGDRTFHCAGDEIIVHCDVDAPGGETGRVYMDDEYRLLIAWDQGVTTPFVEADLY